MAILPLVLAAALGAAPVAAGPNTPTTAAGPDGRTALRAWTYAPDPGDPQATASWPAGRFPGRAVRLPDVANPVAPGSPQAAAAYRGGVGWYRRTVAATGGTDVLRFESVASVADVWVDGRHLAHHLRAYAPFEVRARLKAGPHVVVVRADWRSPARLSREGLHRTWFNWGGIDREVTIRRVGASEVTGVAATTRLRPDGAARLTIRARVANDLRRAQALPVLARLAPAGGDVAPAQVAVLGVVHLAPGAATTITRTITVPHPRLWRLGHGALYDLDVAVPLQSATHARIGLRTVSFSGGVLRIDGRPVVLRGASLQEDAPGRGDALRPADMDRLVARLRRVGANATRAQHPLAPALLERLDAAGIAVWQQIGPVDSPGQFAAGASPLLAARARQDVRDDLQAARLHPSIIAWSLGTEVAGNGAPGQALFVDAAARELHAADPGRGVSVDVWTDHQPAVAGPLYAPLDAVGVTSYFGWYEDFGASLTQQRRLIRARVAGMRRRFAGKVVLVAELGAEGTPDNPPASPGGRGFQAKLLVAQLDALRTAPGLGGAFVWLLSDFQINPAFRGGTITRDAPGIRLQPGLNQKGLFDYAGRAKPAATAVAEALRAWPR